MGAGFCPRGPRREGSRPTVCGAGGNRCARVGLRERCETPGVRVGGEGWRMRPGGGGNWEPAGRPPPPGVLIPEQWPLVFPGLGEGAAGGELGARGGKDPLL